MKKIPKCIIPALISAFIFLLAGLITGTNPYFGGVPNSGDLATQYYSFFGYLRHVLIGNFSDFSYSFSNGLGGSMAGNWGYYLLSPLNFIILLFPANQLNIAIYTIILIKIMIASSSFYYLAKRLNNNSYPIAISLGVAYSLSSYVIGYWGNLMWLDAVALLPLVILGLTKEVLQLKFSLLYILTLAIIIVANYYTGYMICFFLIVFFIYLSFLSFSSWKNLLKQIIYFGISSLSAALLSAFASVPTFYNLLENKLNYHLPAPVIDAKRNLLSIGANLLFRGNISSLPLIYIGTISIILVFAYFFNGKVALKQRIAGLLLLLFTFSGLISTKIYLLWHGGQPPIFYPYRFAFIITFTLIYLASISINHIQHLPQRTFWITNAFLICFIIYYVLIVKKVLGIPKSSLFATLIVLVISIIILNLYILEKINSKFIALLLIVDIFLNTWVTWSTTSKNVTSYNPYTEQTASLINKLPTSAKSQRLEKSFLLNNDRGESYTFNYRGVNVFSSNNDPHLSKLLGLLGLPSIGYYTYYSTGTQLTDALLGIKTYIMSNKATTVKGFSNYGLRDDLVSNKNWYKYKNNIAYKMAVFPLVFAGYSKNNLNLKSNSALLNQEKILQSLTNTKTVYFSNAITPQITSNNMLIKTSNNLISMQQIKKKKSSVIFTYQAKPNSNGYIMLDPTIMSWGKYISDASKMTINGHSFRSLSVNLQPIGIHIPENGKLILKIYWKPSILNKKIIQPNLYLLNENALFKSIQLVQSRKMAITTWKGNSISGTITLHKGQSLLTTIPYSNGWYATANGKKVKIQKYLGCFIALNLPAGKYTIQLNHKMPGFKLGIIISIFGIFVLILLKKLSSKYLQC